MTEHKPISISASLGARLQYVYPKRLLTRLMYIATRIRFRPYKNWQIRWFIRRYKVNMKEALNEDAESYRDFNTFFTRPLRADARPLASGAHIIISPADGQLSDAGNITEGEILEAKGRRFSAQKLLGGDQERAAAFRNGVYTTIYLSPRDYHRVHMPYAGRLREMIYVPGQLFSVNPATVSTVPGLFARNERVITLFDTEAGPMAMVMVGAVFVGSVEQVWSGMVMPPRCSEIHTWRYPKSGTDAVTLGKGDEFGRFNMGSTVIVLFAEGRATWDPLRQPGSGVNMGQCIGHVST